MALILVVEDNEANQMLTRAVLELEGHRVQVATSAEEVMESIRQVRPDLVLMDIQLPGQDGLTLTRALKRDTASAAIPVVALTAHAMNGDREEVLRAGCAGYISKPIDTRTFGETVRQFLSVAGRDKVTT